MQSPWNKPDVKPADRSRVFLAKQGALFAGNYRNDKGFWFYDIRSDMPISMDNLDYWMYIPDYPHD